MQEIIEIFNPSEINWIATIAAISGIVYVILAAKENIWCWTAAIISVFLYIYINYQSGLFAQTGLQVFYLIMALYGYMMWNKEDKERIKEWSISSHIIIIIIGSALTFLLGFYLSQYVKDSYFPIIDALTTVFSIFATYMVAKKVIGNWLYWIVIDLIMVYLYFSLELYILSLQFIVYTVIAFFGYSQWLKKIKTND